MVNLIKNKLWQLFYMIQIIWYGLKTFSSNWNIQKYMARFILHHKLIDKVKILTFRTVTNLRTLFDTIYSKSLKLFDVLKCDAVDSTSQNLETRTNQHVQVNIRKSNMGSLYRRVNARDSAIDENLLKKQQKCSRFYRQYIFSALSKANT